MADGHKQVYLSHLWTDFRQISCADRHMPCKCSLCQKASTQKAS